MNYEIARRVESEFPVHIWCSANICGSLYEVSPGRRAKHHRWAAVYQNAPEKGNWGLILRDSDDGGSFRVDNFTSPLEGLRRAAKWVVRGIRGNRMNSAAASSREQPRKGK